MQILPLRGAASVKKRVLLNSYCVMGFRPRSDICHIYYKDTKVQQLELISEMEKKKKSLHRLLLHFDKKNWLCLKEGKEEEEAAPYFPAKYLTL